MSHPLVGHPAPDFTLVNQQGTPVALSERRERPVLLVFVPFAFSPICTTEILDLRDAGALHRDDAVEVLTISCDSVFSIRAWTESTRYEDDVLSDFWPHGEVCRAYGIFDEERGRAVRASFLIDTSGVVRWAVVNHPDDARSLDDYVAALSAL